jgi:hypothetical protein
LCSLRVGRRCFGLHPLASRAVSKVEMVSVSMEKDGVWVVEAWLCCLCVGRRCFGLHPLASRAVSKVEMVSVSMGKAGRSFFGGS